MSKKLEVNVIKRKYTPRDALQPNRYNIVLNVNAYTPENSYLFIGDIKGAAIEISTFRSNIRKVANEIISLNRVDWFSIQNILKKYPLIKEIRQSTSSAELMNKIYIPSSSLKGAIRSRLEYKLIPKNGSSYSCHIITSLGDVDSSLAKRHIEFWGEDIKYYKAPCNIEISDNVCIVCDIFGSSGLISRVDFSNAYSIDNVKLVRVNIPIGITYDVIPPNTNFKFDIICKNFSIEDLGLLFTALEQYTNSPILIGKFKYRYNPKVGEKLFNKFYFGLLKIKVSNINYVYPEWNYRNIDEAMKASREAIEHYIKNGFLDLNKGVIKWGLNLMNY